MITIKEQKINKEFERAILVGLSAESMPENEKSTDISLDELESLLNTAGGISLGTVLQSRPAPEPRTFIGSGKVSEVKELVKANDCSMVVFDNELSPSQMRALSEELKVKVLDRSGLILDIFAGRAKTKEGRLQVELAQYKYLLPRLTGMWTHLGRQTAAGASGPIGTRGPGETQLESDRRHIHRKITKLEEELEEVRRVRTVQRRLRQKNAVPTIALVGYTNAGKSSLLNTLTAADIQAENRLFDTLDTTTRRLALDESEHALLSDTVGFIRKLPHHLIEAFMATLEELRYADIILHVIDVSNPDWENQAEIVNTLITELDANNTPRLEVYNKCDICDNLPPRGKDKVLISAKTGKGLDELRSELINMLDRKLKQITLMLPYDNGGFLGTIHNDCKVLSTMYRESGIEIVALCPVKIYAKLKQYII